MNCEGSGGLCVQQYLNDLKKEVLMAYFKEEGRGIDKATPT